MSADELGGGVNHNVRTVFDGAQQIGGGEGVVHHQGDVVAVRHFRQSFQVGDVPVGVAQSLSVDQLGVWLDGRLESRRISRIGKGHVQPLILQGVGEQVVSAAVQIGRGNDMIAGHRNVLHRIGDRRRPRGRHQRRRAALQRGQPLFQHVGGGVHQTGVDVAALSQTEATGCLGGVLEHIGGGSVDGHCSCVGGGVGVFLTNVEL